jgi:RNA-directed DNA polymerase
MECQKTNCPKLTGSLPWVYHRSRLASYWPQWLALTLAWSFQHRTSRHYRTFSIPKGNGVRRIDAPRVALKVVQKWLAVQFQRHYLPRAHVFGFVPDRSHVHAASRHCNAKWVMSLDIRNFFQSTPENLVRGSLVQLGYGSNAATLLASLTCLRGALAQGAPTSPVLSNLCFQVLDGKLEKLASDLNVRVTRYADDIVFSGQHAFPEAIKDRAIDLFRIGPWQLAEEKVQITTPPRRLKVHGLLVHGDHVRLTKGYRNRLRAFRHLAAVGQVREEDLSKIRGHISYGDFVARLAESE